MQRAYLLKSDDEDVYEEDFNVPKETLMKKDECKSLDGLLNNLEIYDSIFKFPYEDYRIIGCDPSSNLERRWVECVRLIGKDIGNIDLYNYFVPCQFLDFKDNAITIGVPSMMFYNYIEKQFLPYVSTAIKHTFGKNVELYYEIGISDESQLFSRYYASTEIDKIINSCGFINLDAADIESTLSKETVNYVTVGLWTGDDCMVEALKDAIDKLPIGVEGISKLLFNIWMPRNMTSSMKNLNPLTEFIKDLPQDIDVCCGFAHDESLSGQQVKVTLIAASK